MLAFIKNGVHTGTVFDDLTSGIADFIIGRKGIIAETANSIPFTVTGGEVVEEVVDVLDENGDPTTEIVEHVTPTVKTYGSPSVQEVITGTSKLIDFLAGETREYFVSEGYLVQEEYRMAKKGAKEWMDAGAPSNNVPETIETLATIMSVSAEEVATDILNTAQHWEQVLSSIRTIRLGAKAQLASITDISEASPIVENVHAQLKQVKAQA